MPFTRPFSGHSRSVATRARQVAAVAAVEVAKPAAPSNVIERLEQRSLMSVSLGADGYTDIVKSSDSKVIYVSSSSGSDGNTGLTANSPVKSISKGMSLMRSGSPDHLLLKRGDSWTENLSWSKSGRNSQEPALLGAYGSGSRPTIKAGSGTGIEVGGGTVNHLAIQGIHLSAHTRDPGAAGYSRSTGGYGIRFVGATQGLLIEDTVIDQFKFNMLFQPYNGSLNNVKLRRSIITDAYSGDGSHSSGMYAQGINNLTLEDNLFDHNGWHDSIGGQTSQNHGAYLSEANNNVVVRGNVFANASSHGLQTRAGGEVRDNLFLNNPIHMSFGLVNGAPLKAGGVSGTVDGNVFLGGRTINGMARGWAMELGNIKSATVRNNIMSDDGPGTSGAIMLNVGTNLENAGSGVGINNLTIENNVVHRWYMSLEMSGALNLGGSGNSALNNLVVRNNDFQFAEGTYNRLVGHISSMGGGEESWSNNRYYDEADSSKWFFVGTNNMALSTWKSRLESTAQNVKVNYPNAGANISTYAGSYSNFIAGARKQAEGAWSGTYAARSAINHVRAGFARSTSTTTPTPTPTPTPTTPVVSDTTLPSVVSYTGTSTSVKIKFSENVGASLSATDVTIKHTTNGTTVSGMRLSWDSATNTATWTWSYNGGRLGTGKWSVLLPDQNVADAAGNRLAGGQDFLRYIYV